jgi:poly(3-hydroxybutyrate) depolymerase
MLRCTLFVAVATVALMALPGAARAEDEATVSIVSPADGTVVTFGEPITVEIELSRTLEGSPFSLRVDGKGVWIGQQSYRKSFDSTEWGEGRHWLQAAVFKDDDEITSPAVWVEVVAPEPEEPPEPGEPGEPEAGGFAAPAESYREGLGQRPATEGFGLPFSDGFEDEDLDSANWMRYLPTPGIEVVEFDHELRIAGEALSAEAGGAAATVKAFFNEPIDCSVWFRLQELGCDECAVSLAIHSESGAVHIRYQPTIGYVLFSSGRQDQLRTAPAFGDEASEWHQLRLAYDPSEGSARGFVDGVLLGTVSASIEGFAVSAGVVVWRYGCFLDVRFDDFELKRLGDEPEQLPPPADIVEEEAEWDRDPWLGPDEPLVPGQIVERRTPYGDYFEYVPHTVVEPALVAIVSHGSYGDDQMDLELSRVSARRSIHERGWLLLADTTGLILVAPSFDHWRFYGYRFLKGSPIDADEFIFRIVDSYRGHFDAVDNRIILVGHSAGAQFAQRFLLVHPHRVFAAVLSSAGTYTFPDETVDWPYGRRNSPNPDGFLEATVLPVRVVMGSRDTGDATGMGVAQRGDTRVDRADAWVDAMRQFANDNGLEPRIHLVVIPGAGHSAWALDVNGAWWLAGIIDTDRAERQPPGTVPGFPGMQPPY